LLKVLEEGEKEGRASTRVIHIEAKRWRKCVKSELNVSIG